MFTLPNLFDQESDGNKGKSGDIHPHPGPELMHRNKSQHIGNGNSTKNTCESCAKTARSNQKCLICCECHHIFHIKCIPMSSDSYVFYQDNPWACNICSLPQLSDSFFDNSLNNNNSILSLASSNTSTDSSIFETNLIQVALFNARSVVNKIEEFHARIAIDELDILIVTETWLDSSIDSTELFPDSFVVYRKDRSRHGGGVLLALKNAFKSSIVDFPTNIEVKIIEITVNNNFNVLICAVYRPPSSNDDWLNQFHDVVDFILSILHKYCGVILTGDFNYDYGVDSPLVYKKFKEIIAPLDTIQFVDFFTRVSNTKSSIIDLVLCNNPDIVCNFRSHPGLSTSDHLGVYFNINARCSKVKPVDRYYYQYSKCDHDDLFTTLGAVPWGLCLEQSDCEEMWENFKDLFLATINDCIPKVKSKKRNRPAWITQEMVTMARKKKRMLKEAHRHPHNLNKMDKYRKFSNKLRNLTKKAHLQYIRKLSVACVNGDSKRFFSYVKTRRKTGQVKNFVFNGIPLVSDIDAVNAFSTFFASNFNEPNRNFNVNHEICNCVHPDIVPLNNINITEKTIFEALLSLKPNKSPGPDGITPKMLSMSAPIIAPVLCKMFNKFLTDGFVPKDWKLANVTPIFKSGNRNDVNNYRPISLCSIIGKVFERIIADNILFHLQFFGFISPTQHGFYPGRSCVTQASALYHDWSQTMDVRQPPVIDAIFLDWEKAFDRVPHDLVIKKLHNMGVCGSLLKCLHSFLSDRFQRVVLNKEHSDWDRVGSGVPQGSVLGPLLFNLFVYDLPLNTSSVMKQYADDTVIYKPVFSRHDALTLQQDLCKISKWCEDNKMKLNAKKCKVMHITRKRNYIPHFIYTIESNPLEAVNSHKYLGINFSRDLTWSAHVNDVSMKSMRMLGFIKRFVGFNDTEILLRLFNALCRPVIEYGAPVWDPHQKQHNIAINKSLRRVTKLCVEGDFTDRLKILNLPDMKRGQWLMTVYPGKL
ncbi:uncharacterized protein [Antedon mediterranea]|uniref:uncharacterized protein n=1 Tax=Antedon mediterranea TaxID=105859 RepID=UPI003AF9F31B